MRKLTFIIITLLLISFMALLLLWLFTRPQPSTIVTPTPTAPPQTNDVVSPTPNDEISVTGAITQISQVSYKNSTLLEINDTSIYVTDESEIRDAEGTSLDAADLTTGTTVSVTGVPAEGGIEAQEVIAISQITITPTRAATPTP